MCNPPNLKHLLIIFNFTVVLSLTSGRNQISSQFIKKMIRKLLTSIDLIHYCLPLGKYYKNSFLNFFFNNLRSKDHCLNISLAFNQMTLAQIRWCSWFMTYVQLSMLTLLLKCVVFFRHVKYFQQSLARRINLLAKRKGHLYSSIKTYQMFSQ